MRQGRTSRSRSSRRRRRSPAPRPPEPRQPSLPRRDVLHRGAKSKSAPHVRRPNAPLPKAGYFPSQRRTSPTRERRHDTSCPSRRSPSPTRRRRHADERGPPPHQEEGRSSDVSLRRRRRKPPREDSPVGRTQDKRRSVWSPDPTEGEEKNERVPSNGRSRAFLDSRPESRVPSQGLRRSHAQGPSGRVVKKEEGDQGRRSRAFLDGRPESRVPSKGRRSDAPEPSGRVLVRGDDGSRSHKHQQREEDQRGQPLPRKEIWGKLRSRREARTKAKDDARDDDDHHPRRQPDDAGRPLAHKEKNDEHIDEAAPSEAARPDVKAKGSVVAELDNVSSGTRRLSSSPSSKIFILLSNSSN